MVRQDIRPAGRMDGEHKHHWDVLDAFKRDIVTCPDLQSRLLTVALTVADKAHSTPVCSSISFGNAAQMKDNCAARMHPFALEDYGRDRVLSCDPEHTR